MPSNQQNQCYIGPLWPTKYWNLYNKPQQCRAIKMLNLLDKYLLLVTFEIDDNYSIRFELKKHYSHSTDELMVTWTLIIGERWWHDVVSTAADRLLSRCVVCRWRQKHFAQTIANCCWRLATGNQHPDTGLTRTVSKLVNQLITVTYVLNFNDSE